MAAPTVDQVDAQGNTTSGVGEITYAFPGGAPADGVPILFWVSARTTGVSFIGWNALPSGLTWLEGPTAIGTIGSAGWVIGEGDGSTNSFVFDPTGTAVKVAVIGYEIAGADATSPIRGSSPVATGTSSSASPAGETVVDEDLVLVGVVGLTSSGGVSAWDGDFVTDDSLDTTASGGGRLITTSAQDTITANGTTDPTATLAGSVDWAISTVVISPTPTIAQTTEAELGLATIADPGQSNGHFLQLRLRQTGTDDGRFVIQFKEGAAVLESWTVYPTTSFALRSLPITPTVAANITDYSNLSVTIQGIANGGGETMTAEVSWLALIVATVYATASLYTTGTGTIADVVDETDATSSLHESVDDDPDSPNDADWVNNTDDAGQVFFALTDMPGDFDSMVSVSIEARWRGQGF